MGNSALYLLQANSLICSLLPGSWLPNWFDGNANTSKPNSIHMSNTQSSPFFDFYFTHLSSKIGWDISLKLIIGLQICNNDYNHLLFVQQHEPVLVHNVIAILRFEAGCLGTTLLPVLVIKLCKLIVVGLRESTAMLPQHNPWV
jgi:hypothetical protein